MTEQYPPGSIGASGDEVLIERIKLHFGDWALSYSVGVLAQFDDGDIGDSDPRTRASQKALGEETARGGSGPKKKKR